MKYLALPSLLIASLLQSALAGGFGPGPWANGAYYNGQLDGSYSANVYNNTQDRLDFSEMGTPSGNIVRTDTYTTTFKTNVTSASSTVISNTGGIYTTSSVTTLTTNVVEETTADDSGTAGVVSGIIGFGISGGSPSVSSNGTTGAGTNSGSINVDASANYFVIYVDGNTYAGQTAAGINLNTQRVAGSLISGLGTGYSFLTPLASLNTNTGTLTLTYPPQAVPPSTASGYFNAKIKSDKSPFIFKGAGEISTRQIDPFTTATSGFTTYPFNLDGIKVSDN